MTRHAYIAVLMVVTTHMSNEGLAESKISVGSPKAKLYRSTWSYLTARSTAMTLRECVQTFDR